MVLSLVIESKTEAHLKIKAVSKTTRNLCLPNSPQSRLRNSIGRMSNIGIVREWLSLVVSARHLSAHLTDLVFLKYLAVQP